MRWPVESDQGVEVDDAASLELGHLRELHPHQLPTGRLRQPEMTGEPPTQSDREPAPQLRRPPLPHQMPQIVVAVRAERLPHHAVVMIMGAHAPQPAAMRADLPSLAAAGTAAPGAALAGLLRRVHRTERGCSQRGEHQRMRHDLGGHVLHPAGRAGHDQMEHVALVLMRARLTHRATPVLAPQVRDPVRLTPRRVAAQHLTRGGVDGVGGADHPDRLCAGTDLLHLRQPTAQVGPGQPLGDLRPDP